MVAPPPPVDRPCPSKLNSKISKILAPNFPKFPPLCFGKSCPLGRAILEILEIRKVRGFQNFQKSPPLCFGKSCPLGLEIWEFLEILDFLEVLEFLELISGGLIVTHPMTDHALLLACKGKVCQYSCPYLGRISIYVYIYIYIYIYIHYII